MFPGKDEVQVRLDSGECVTRHRQGASSEVWNLFKEVVYANNCDFTGYVQCEECKWLLRFHGQLTGTSHMRRHKCFMKIHPEIREKYYRSGSKGKTTDTSVTHSNNQAVESNTFKGEEEKSENDHSLIPLIDAEKNEPIDYLGCTKCAIFVKKSETNPSSHVCKASDLSRNISISGRLYFRAKLLSRAWKQSHLWKYFDEVIDAATLLPVIYVRCRRCLQMVRSVDSKAIPSVLRRHESQCPEKDSQSIMNAAVSSDSLAAPVTVTSENVKLVAKPGMKLVDCCLNFCAMELLDPAILTRKPFVTLARTIVNIASRAKGKSTRFPSEALLQGTLADNFKLLLDQQKTLAQTVTADCGGALIYARKDDLDVIVMSYVNSQWTPIQTVIAAKYDVTDAGQFVEETLSTLQLSEEAVQNLIIVSRDKINCRAVTLPSSAHEIDDIVVSTVKSDDLYQSYCDKCLQLLNQYNINFAVDRDISWIRQFTIFKQFIDNESTFSPDHLNQLGINCTEIKFIVSVLTPFKEASNELRSCTERSTCNLIFLWYHKLVKILSNLSKNATLDLPRRLESALEEKFTVTNVHKCATFLWPNFRCLKMLSTASRNDVHHEIRSFLSFTGNETTSQPTVAKRAKSDFSDWEDIPSEGQDEVDSFIGAILPSCDEDHLLSWWSGHSSDFPRLSKLARKILAVPASVTFLDDFKPPIGRVDPRLILMHFQR